jgi:hypothetical protein
MSFIKFLNEKNDSKVFFEKSSGLELVAFVELDSIRKSDADEIISLIKDRDEKELIKHITYNYEIEHEPAELEKLNVKTFKYKEYTLQYNDVTNTVSVYAKSEHLDESHSATPLSLDTKSGLLITSIPEALANRV